MCSGRVTGCCSLTSRRAVAGPSSSTSLMRPSTRAGRRSRSARTMPAPINHWSASAGSSCWPWSSRGAASRVTICRTAALWPSTGSVSCTQRSIRERVWAIEHARAWVRGEVKMMQARAAGGHAMGAARDLRGAARYAAYAAGQAGVVAHVAAHELGAAAYAIKAVWAAVVESERDQAGRLECQWQREQLPEKIRDLVLDDQK